MAISKNKRAQYAEAAAQRKANKAKSKGDPGRPVPPHGSGPAEWPGGRSAGVTVGYTRDDQPAPREGGRHS